MTWPGVTVVVVHRGSPALLAGCLSSVRALDYPKSRLDLIVVEKERTPAISRLLGRRPCALHLSSDLNNYCRANNLAVRRARTPLVALLNNDCRVRPDWLGRLVATLRLDPGLGGCMGKILMPSGKIYSAGHEVLKAGHWRDLGFGQTDGLAFDLPRARQSLTHAACVFRREAYLQVGGMDERFLMYFDDVELGYRLRRKGWRFFYVPAATAVHQRWPDSESPWRAFLCHRNRLFFAAKHRPDHLEAWISHSHLTHDPAAHLLLYQVLPEIVERISTLRGKAAAKRLLPALDRAMTRKGVPAAFRATVLDRAARASQGHCPDLLLRSADEVREWRFLDECQKAWEEALRLQSPGEAPRPREGRPSPRPASGPCKGPRS